MCLYFLAFVNIEMAKFVEILPCEKVTADPT